MTTVNKNICMRLIEAQKEFPRIVQDQEAKAFGSGRGYSYANISSCLDAILPILNKHGLAVVQKTTTEEDRVGIETVLVSEEGETLSSGVFFVTTAGLQQKGVQAFGSAVTYARRYSFVSFLGLSYGEEDDDGRQASEDAYSKGKTRAPAKKAAPQPKQPAPQPAQVSEDEKYFNLVEEAKRVCLDGLEAYKAFYSKLHADEKQYLVKTKIHEQLKQEATNA